MNTFRKYLSIVALLGLLGAFATACSSGGGSSNGGNNNAAKVQLSGVAAAGAPIVGIVNVKGANGATASSPIDATGHFSLDVTALTANYILYAEGTVNGKSVRLYSAAVAAGNINITPITDLIVASAYQDLPQNAYAAWNGSQVDSTTLDTATTQIQTSLAPVLTAVGVSSTADPMTMNFNADGTGMDQALDVLDVNYAGTTATVTNTVTGSTCTVNVTTGTSTALPTSDTAATQTAMTELQAINVFWAKIQTLWATSKPSLATVIAQLGPYVANDSLNGGQNKDTWLAGLVNDGPQPGIKITAAITEPMSSGTGTYQKGYWIRVNYTMASETGSFVDSMVYDGTNWLEYGDRRWVQSEDRKSVV